MTDTSADAFDVIARHALEILPEPFRSLAKDLLIQIVDVADAETLSVMNIPDAMELLGLYQGTDVTEKSLFDMSPLPDMVFLYRLPIIRFWEDGDGTDSLQHIVTHVLIHEIGHHFGLSDDDMEALEAEADPTLET